MSDDRRQRPRLRLSLGVQLCRGEGHAAVRTETDNLSSEGFYCTSREPFSPGDRLECDLFIPGTGSGSPGLVLNRSVKVVRVEIRGLEPGFGIACRFERSL
jgi:hypothetical protein